MGGFYSQKFMSDAPAPVTVIVVTFNSRAHFPALRSALESQTAPHRLIVLDNGSQVEQRPCASDFPADALIVQNEINLGFAAANNRGVAMAQTPFVLLLNPDAYPEPDCLAQLLDAAMRHPEAACIGATLLQARDPGRYDGAGDCMHVCGATWRGDHGKPRKDNNLEAYVFSACAAAALYRTDAWRDAGGFDESFFCYQEDVDLGFRLRLAGHETMLAPAALARHVGGASSPASRDFEAYHTARNAVWTLLKNMPGRLLWIALPAHLAWTLYLLCSAFLRGRGAPVARGLRDAWRDLPYALESRRRIQKNRKARVLFIARALTWSPLAIIQRAAKRRAIPQ